MKSSYTGKEKKKKSAQGHIYLGFSELNTKQITQKYGHTSTSLAWFPFHMAYPISLM